MEGIERDESIKISSTRLGDFVTDDSLWFVLVVLVSVR